ncbi:MAG: 16S rRNA (uracil(1498)-N(3))-methyltransferase [Candidatus Dadabacteria bacterium]
MSRFPVRQSQIKNGQAIISGSDYKHIVKALRLKVGHKITLFDERGMEYNGVIAAIEKGKISVAIAESRNVETESNLNIILLQGVPKGNKMDFIVEKATELGVKTIVPVVTERSQIRDTKKIQRWQRIAIESSKQCGRTTPPDIHTLKNFRDIVELNYVNVLRIILHKESKHNIKYILNNDLQVFINIIIFVGSEGGFSDEEIKMAEEKGFVPVALGPRILRTETAGIVAISILQYMYGDI